MRGATILGRRRTYRDSHFNPRTPCGVRLWNRTGCILASVFQSTHPVRGATEDGPHFPGVLTISIHAPRAGCDHILQLHNVVDGDFNPRTPCGVRPSSTLPPTASKSVFQSTHPVRGATKSWSRPWASWRFQSTHPVRGATGAALLAQAEAAISIHAPRAGCDFGDCHGYISLILFQSTHPVRGATSPGCPAAPYRSYFNPRTPCGVRRR